METFAADVSAVVPCAAFDFHGDFNFCKGDVEAPVFEVIVVETFSDAWFIADYFSGEAVFHCRCWGVFVKGFELPDKCFGGVGGFNWEEVNGHGAICYNGRVIVIFEGVLL